MVPNDILKPHTCHQSSQECCQDYDGSHDDDCQSEEDFRLDQVHHDHVVAQQFYLGQ